MNACRDDLVAHGIKKWIGADYERLGLRLRESRECRVYVCSRAGIHWMDV
jgi:hypothetical protein